MNEFYKVKFLRGVGYTLKDTPEVFSQLCFPGIEKEGKLHLVLKGGTCHKVTHKPYIGAYYEGNLIGYIPASDVPSILARREWLAEHGGKVLCKVVSVRGNISLDQGDGKHIAYVLYEDLPSHDGFSNFNAAIQRDAAIYAFLNDVSMEEALKEIGQQIEWNV